MLQLVVTMQNFAARLRDEERGATAVEYGLLIALIGAVIIFAVTALGTNLSEIFTNVGDRVGDGAAPAGG